MSEETKTSWSPRAWIAAKLIRRFGERYSYDTGYLQAMLRSAPAVLFKFSKNSGAVNYRSYPIEAYYAVKQLAAIAVDCGPCTQLCVDMAREAGVDTAQTEAVLTGAREAMSPDTRLGFDSGRAMALKGEGLVEARAAVLQRFGEAAVVELAF